MPRLVLRLLALCACLTSSGCYVLQAAQGQMSVMSRRQPIPGLIADPATAPALRTRLEYVAAAREFATRELGLPDNASYRTYKDIGRDFVVWNVFATREFSVTARRWCFPIAGCVAYRGYFHESSAQRYARRLRARGYDVTVGGVPAYSTLGHFADPVLNTMLSWNDARLAGTVFHELAHQEAYARGNAGDSEFNEAFATVVENVGITRWLQSRGDAAGLERWHAARERERQFADLLLTTRTRLQSLYKTKIAPAALRERKQQEFGRLLYEYGLLKGQWNGYAGYDRWFERALNNADLVPIATYYGCEPSLQRLLEASGNDLPRFYAAVRQLAGAPSERRQFCRLNSAERGVE